MSNDKSGNAGVTILVIVIILIIAGVLFFRNSADAPAPIDETATTTPTEESMDTMPVAPAPVMEDGATATGSAGVSL